MTVEPKISVIIPIWNVEKYLNKCIESIVNQTYKNLEILLIDDGSPDNCPQLCDEWAKKDSRIKVIHKENGGVSSARNSGLQNATGEYIAFVDSDDYIDLTMYEKMYQKSKDDNSNLVLCERFEIGENGNISKIVKEINLKNLEKEEPYKYFVMFDFKEKNGVKYTHNIMGAIWRCLFKKELLDNVKFQNFKFCEDLIFMIDVFKKNPKVSVIEEPLYYYVDRESSYIGNYSYEKMCYNLIVSEYICKILADSVTEAVLKTYQYHNYVWLIYKIIKFKDKIKIKELSKNKIVKNFSLKENYRHAMKNTKNIKLKILYFLVRHKLHILHEIALKFVK